METELAVVWAAYEASRSSSPIAQYRTDETPILETGEDGPNAPSKFLACVRRGPFLFLQSGVDCWLPCTHSVNQYSRPETVPWLKLIIAI